MSAIATRAPLSAPAVLGAPAVEAVAPAQPRAYPALSKVLHWLIAIMIAGQILSGVAMKQLGAGPLADFAYTLHKTTGATLLVLVVLRLGYRLALKAFGGWQRYASMLPIHMVLYGALILIPLLGWAGVSDYGARGLLFGLSLPPIWPQGAGYDGLLFSAHAFLAFTLLGLVAAHIGVALGMHIKRGAAGEDPSAAPDGPGA